MKTFVPQYYTKFVCRADKCKHTCCAGWEIDIDERTLSRYNAVSGEFGERIKKSITMGDGMPCFALNYDKCPFLNDSGLCDIITVLGEEYLCQICSDHPRFRNFQKDRTEIGLGLACEAVASLVLFSNEYDLVEIDDDGKTDSVDEWERYLLEKREVLFNLAKSSNDFAEKIKYILAEVGAKLPSLNVKRWRKIYLSLERLDEKWTTVLENLKPISVVRNENIYTRVLVYMLFRHILFAENESDLRARTAFAVHATLFISAVADTLQSLGELNCDCESARLYSSEIEYSDDNLYSLIDLFVD